MVASLQCKEATVRMLVGTACGYRRAVARLVIPVAATAAMVAMLDIAAPAHSADLDYGPYGPPPNGGPPPYGYQPPRYSDRTPAYPSQRDWPPREVPYSQHRYPYQPSPYDSGAAAYPPQRQLSSREGPYGEPYTYQPPPYDYRAPAEARRRYVQPYDEQTYDRRPPAYPSYRPSPDGYDYGDRGNGYRPYGYADPSYDPYRGAAIEPGPPRPPASILEPPGGWVADAREPPDDRQFEAPPYERWPPYPPRRW
jgi:hypothetical protein